MVRISQMAEQIVAHRTIAHVYEDLLAAENMLLQCCGTRGLDMRLQ